MSISIWKTEYTRLQSCSGAAADWFEGKLNDSHTFFVSDEDDRAEFMNTASSIKDQETREEVRTILKEMELETDYSFF